MEASPLLSDDPHAWDELIESVGAAQMLVFIGLRMGPELRARCEPHDVWQETLLAAWRDRASCEWRGLHSFRRWLATIAENRLRTLAETHATLKRGGGRVSLPLSVNGSSSQPSLYAGPIVETTPSRHASDLEEAARLSEALAALPADCRDVVRLRLIDDQTTESTAAELGLGVGAVKHRFRRGAQLLREALGDPP